MILTSSIHNYTGAGFEQVALIRSELDSLSECLANIGSHNDKLALKDVEEKFKACRDKCHEAFKKLGEENEEHEQQVKRIRELEQQNEKLKQENDELNAKHSSGTSKAPPIRLVVCNHP